MISTCKRINFTEATSFVYSLYVTNILRGGVEDDDDDDNEDLKSPKSVLHRTQEKITREWKPLTPIYIAQPQLA